MSTRKQDASKRAARLTEIREQQRRAERRRTALITGVNSQTAELTVLNDMLDARHGVPVGR